jgi:hypothetical protein
MGNGIVQMRFPFGTTGDGYKTLLTEYTLGVRNTRYKKRDVGGDVEENTGQQLIGLGSFKRFLPTTIKEPSRKKVPAKVKIQRLASVVRALFSFKSTSDYVRKPKNPQNQHYSKTI